ncbi:DUF6580 family putative transport protein [Acidicapsa dinghuensis]|uniref:DUF6580 family putative transport protein n=1 Tax=Acidicapsa dinghuensis TaxID=2218256 RepID=A0ABW1EAJ9_9BACT|nr:DUF6580 family putative transport protein [Acidicapsa dinghuensis]
MVAYLLLLAAILIRPGILPHPGWLDFSMLGAALLYFGARRNWREALLPVAVLAGVDYYLTTHVYGYAFAWQDYTITWAWYAAAIVLGHILLSTRVSVVRVASATLLGPTAFFLASNYAAWLGMSKPGGIYAPTFSGLMTSYIAGVPFYGRDLLSTGIVLTLAFGVPVAIRHFAHNRALPTHSTL